MKRGGSIIPLAQRAEMAANPEYSRCSLIGYHECGGSISWEHALIFRGQKCQMVFSIIPLCSRGHAVNEYQDAGTMNKEMNVWVALNRATDEELRSISKAINYLRERDRLNKKFGVYVPPPIPDKPIAAKESPFKVARKPREKVDEREREARSFARANGCDIEQARELLDALN